jgi:uncharacterized membrane protein YkvA (DUF1232 family)
VRTLLVVLVALVGAWLLVIGALILAGRRTAAARLATVIPNLVLLFKGLIRDPRVSRGSKLWLALGAAWIASPIDLIPEFIPFLGPLDDAVVAALILRHVLRTAGPEVVADHWRGDPATLEWILRLVGASR